MSTLFRRVPRLPWRAPGAALTLGGVALPLGVLGALGAEVLEREPFSPELAAMLWLHLHSPAWLVALSQGLHVLGSPLVMWPVLVALPAALWLTRRRPQAVFAGLALWGATGVQWGLKQLFERSRPDLWPRVVPEHGYAFPSGHTTVAAALALVLGVLAWHTPRRWLVVTVGAAYAALMALSRVVLGVHYPSDVLAGILTAMVSVLGLLLLLRPDRAGGR
ncbi:MULTISPECIES: phosphatase PAP2 family protein [Deinococcus]|uniref:Phosphatase PAP2 family protein n=1 Tax=Deinococcus rufus TaxID=2136097 RepID=A0ABV7Z662_9DEIO|nr:phosphatase PAP2 family protein [Deinococcus sp. AB2017081]WQE97229.1 phosphatase PAP2 family protein [Deinococcus sp. AB2017081]